MAAEPDEQATRPRATVELVSEQVKSLGLLISEKFSDLQRQLDAVAGLPTKVASFEAWARSEMKALEQRVRDLEDGKQRFPTLLISVIAVVFSGLGVLFAYIALNQPA